LCFCPAQGAEHIVLYGAKTQYRRSQLSSNVSQHKRSVCVLRAGSSQIELLAVLFRAWSRCRMTGGSVASAKTKKSPSRFPWIRGIGQSVVASRQQNARHKPKQSISSLSRRARNEVSLRRLGSARRSCGAPRTSPTQACRLPSGVASLGIAPRRIIQVPSVG